MVPIYHIHTCDRNLGTSDAGTSLEAMHQVHTMSTGSFTYIDVNKLNAILYKTAKRACHLFEKTSHIMTATLRAEFGLGTDPLQLIYA